MNGWDERSVCIGNGVGEGPEGGIDRSTKTVG